MKLRNLILTLLLALSCGALAQTPEQTVQKFADLITRKDIDGAAALVKNGKVPAEVKQEMAKSPQWPTLTLSNLSTKINGDTAKVTYTMHATGIGDVADHEEVLDLEKTSTGWMILPPKEMDFGMRSLLPGVAYLFGNPKAMEGAQGSAKSTACVSNLKQLALATIMFTTDNDDVLKTTGAKWKTSIFPYCKNESLFTCPEDPKGTMSYSFNSSLANVNMAKIKNPANTVLAYEGAGGKLKFRHNDKAAVAFADGHVKLLTKEQAKTLSWKP